MMRIGRQLSDGIIPHFAGFRSFAFSRCLFWADALEPSNDAKVWLFCRIYRIAGDARGQCKPHTACAVYVRFPRTACTVFITA